ncbi:hypothetical protein [Paenibacillus nasutitermitis]|nr:hypothetical protein [Paenibacillus nasutitermitis]
MKSMSRPDLVSAGNGSLIASIKKVNKKEGKSARWISLLFVIVD